MRGTVIKVPDSNPGIISADGKQYSFELTGAWQGDAAPTANQVVEFTPSDTGAATAITPVSREVLAQENLNKAGKIAKEKTGEYYKVIKPYVDMQVQAMTLPVLVLAVIVELSYLFLTGVQYGTGSTPINFSCSLDQALGADFSVVTATVRRFVNTLTDGFPGLDLPRISNSLETTYGFWRFVGEVLVFIPWIAPWLPIPHRKLLNALPLVAVVSVYAAAIHKVHQAVSDFFASIQQSINSAQAQLGALGGGMPPAPGFSQHDIAAATAKVAQPLSFGVGFWVALIASAALLATVLLKKQDA